MSENRFADCTTPLNVMIRYGNIYPYTVTATVEQAEIAGEALARIAELSPRTVPEEAWERARAEVRKWWYSFDERGTVDDLVDRIIDALGWTTAEPERTAATCGMGDENPCTHGTRAGRYCRPCDTPPTTPAPATPGEPCASCESTPDVLWSAPHDAWFCEIHWYDNLFTGHSVPEIIRKLARELSVCGPGAWDHRKLVAAAVRCAVATPPTPAPDLPAPVVELDVPTLQVLDMIADHYCDELTRVDRLDVLIDGFPATLYRDELGNTRVRIGGGDE